MKRLGELFWAFFRIGALTFGGGYAMIALLDHECVEKRQWLTADELMDITVVAESTPGPIAINCATYTGWRQGRACRGSVGDSGDRPAGLPAVLGAELLLRGTAGSAGAGVGVPGYPGGSGCAGSGSRRQNAAEAAQKAPGTVAPYRTGSWGLWSGAAGPGTGLAHLHHRTDAARRDRRCAALPGDPAGKGAENP